MNFLLNWFLYTLAIIITAYLLPGVTVESLAAALIAALVLGIINAVIRPVILILTLPLNILTLGLLTFVVNALLVLLGSAVVPGFHVAGFWWAIFFSVILSIINAVLGQIKKT